MQTKIYIIGCAGVPARYGGFETFAENLGAQLTHFSSVHIACSTSLYPADERHSRYQSIHRYFIDHPANGIYSLLYDLKALLHAVRHTDRNDRILVLGVTAGIYLPLIRLFYKRSICVHLDGLEWKRAKWNVLAKTFLRIGRRLALRFSDQCIIDNEALRDYLPVRYRQRVHHVGYGCDHLPAERSLTKPEAFEYSLVVARAEPENNLELILKTYSGLPDKHLIVITNARSTRHGRYLLKKYGDIPTIHFRDALYDPAGKLHSYRSFSKLYLHGHSVGGTNPSLVEAMYYGIPVACFDNVFNRETSRNEALYFKEETQLKELIEALYNKRYAKLGDKLRSIAEREYTWRQVAEDFEAIF